MVLKNGTTLENHQSAAPVIYIPEQVKARIMFWLSYQSHDPDQRTKPRKNIGAFSLFVSRLIHTKITAEIVGMGEMNRDTSVIPKINPITQTTTYSRMATPMVFIATVDSLMMFTVRNLCCFESLLTIIRKKQTMSSKVLTNFVLFV